MTQEPLIHYPSPSETPPQPPNAPTYPNLPLFLSRAGKLGHALFGQGAATLIIILFTLSAVFTAAVMSMFRAPYQSTFQMIYGSGKALAWLLDKLGFAVGVLVGLPIWGLVCLFKLLSWKIAMLRYQRLVDRVGAEMSDERDEEDMSLQNL